MKLPVNIRMAGFAALIGIKAYSAYTAPTAFNLVMFLIIVLLALDKATWLPFLGETVIPISLLQPSIPSRANHKVEVVAPENAQRIVYWASSTPNASHPSDAYGEFSNAGVSDIVDGVGVISIRMPQEYSVHRFGYKKQIPRHVHYRWIYRNGMLSEVKTAFV